MMAKIVKVTVPACKREEKREKDKEFNSILKYSHLLIYYYPLAHHIARVAEGKGQAQDARADVALGWPRH
jgi:hypothetical protein